MTDPSTGTRTGAAPRFARAARSLVICSILMAVTALPLAGCGRKRARTPSAVRPSRSAPSVADQPAQDQTRPTAEPTVIPQGGPIPLYDLKITPKDLAAWENTAFSNETFPASFSTDGVVYDGARIRYRGAWARGWPKKPLKIFFAKGNRFNDERCLDLNSGWRDPAFIREPLAYHIFSACGAVASTTKLVRVQVNGAFRGVYIQIEQPDKALLKRHHLEGAALYKANSQNNQADERAFPNAAQFQAHYEKETLKSEDYTDLQQFCAELANTRDVPGFFAARVDVDRYINFLAATALVQNWDGFNKNHFLAHDVKGSGKWLPIPWDLDRTFGDHWNQSFGEARLPLLLGTRSQPGITGWNRLQDRFFSDPALTARFLDRLQELLQTEFTPDRLFPVLDQLEAQVNPWQAAEVRRWPRYSGDFHRGIAGVKSFIEQRRAFLLAEVKRLRGH